MPASTTHQRLRRALEDVDFPAEKDVVPPGQQAQARRTHT